MEELIRRGIPAELVASNVVDAAETELEKANKQCWVEYNKFCCHLEAFAADGRTIEKGNMTIMYTAQWSDAVTPS